jgi:small subunit ribosomal protein S8
MSWSDPIADMLTRIRNGARSRKTQVTVKASRICEGIATVLKTEGYIDSVERIEDATQGILRITLRYDPDGKPAITEIRRVSKPGRRIYAGVESLPKVLGGMGITVVSTSKGIVSDRGCRANKMGGEVLCMVS